MTTATRKTFRLRHQAGIYWLFLDIDPMYQVAHRSDDVLIESRFGHTQLSVTHKLLRIFAEKMKEE